MELHEPPQYPEFSSLTSQQAQVKAFRLIEEAAVTGAWISSDLPEQLIALRKIIRGRKAN